MKTRFNDFLNEGRVPKSDRIKLLDDENYLIVAPITNRASQKYGAFTKWCTSVPEDENGELAADIEKTNTNGEGCDKLLLYVLNKKTKPNMEVAERYRLLNDVYKGEVFSDDDDDDEGEEGDSTRLDEYNEKHKDNLYSLNKVAIYLDKKGNYTIWDAANNELTEEGLDLDDLGIDDYAIDIIDGYLNFNNK